MGRGRDPGSSPAAYGNGSPSRRPGPHHCMGGRPEAPESKASEHQAGLSLNSTALPEPSQHRHHHVGIQGLPQPETKAYPLQMSRGRILRTPCLYLACTFARIISHSQENVWHITRYFPQHRCWGLFSCRAGGAGAKPSGASG